VRRTFARHEVENPEDKRFGPYDVCDELDYAYSTVTFLIQDKEGFNIRDYQAER
jgi:hypothetical protein